jgi:hypothetical protein
MPIQAASETVALPIVLSRMVDGAVACVWRLNSDDGIIVTRHLGKESQVICQFPGKLYSGYSNPRPFADSQGRLWITGEGPTIYRAGSDGPPLTYHIPPEQLLNAENAIEGYNPLHAIEDGRGRIWVWSSMREGT